MNYNLLGRSSLQVSEIGFGCMSLGDHAGENALLINKAIDGGINLFDTADMYANGKNEEALGSILKGRRHQVVIATKVGNQLRADGSGTDWNPRK